MSCTHKWVMYQPFHGEAYECCANAGCGIKKSEYKEALQEEIDALYANIVKMQLDLGSPRVSVGASKDTDAGGIWSLTGVYKGAIDSLQKDISDSTGVALTDDQLCFDLSDDEEEREESDDGQ